jgi:uncharacterized phage protein (TIGR02218 family)
VRASTNAQRLWLMQNNIAWRADTFTISLVNPPAGVPSVLRYTSADFDLAYQGETFVRNVVLRRTNTRQSSKLAGGVILGGKTLAMHAANGMLDEARVRVDHWYGAYGGDLTNGPVTAWFEGRVAAVDPTPQTIRLSVKSELEILNQTLPRFLYGPSCTHCVYDANCGLDKGAKTVTLTALAASVPGTLNAVSSQPTGYYDLGVVTMTGNVTPALTGCRRAVKAGGYNVGGTFKLSMPLPFAPAAGDTFTIYPGCDRSYATCSAKFGNTVAFRGYPHMPPPEGAT